MVAAGVGRGWGRSHGPWLGKSLIGGIGDIVGQEPDSGSQTLSKSLCPNHRVPSLPCSVLLNKALPGVCLSFPFVEWCIHDSRGC